MKTCTKCEETKPLTEFHNDKSRHDGKFPQCRDCGRVSARERYQRNPEPAKQRAKQFREANPEQVREWKQRHYRSNAEDYKARAAIARARADRDPNRPWPTDECSYNAAHQRVHMVYGPAKGHPCTDCGNNAADWSYRGGSDKELTEIRVSPWCPSGVVVGYSPDPADYDPRCKSCHTKYDARERIPA